MAVRNALLGLLAQRPRHGYELHGAFEAIAGGRELWALKPAQVYTTLGRLEEGGLIATQAVAQEGGPEKRIYAITEAGAAELQRWMAEPVASQHQRDEFFLKLMLSVATGVADPYSVIRTQRAALFRELHDLTRRRGAADPATALAVIMLLDRAAMHLEADLRWLDMLEERLDAIRRQPLAAPEPRPRGRPPRGENGASQ
jgi:DNA-binding PadR family transcriptional regulator